MNVFIIEQYVSLGNIIIGGYKKNMISMYQKLMVLI